jgi:acetyl esterase/lipase
MAVQPIKTGGQGRTARLPLLWLLFALAAPLPCFAQPVRANLPRITDPDVPYGSDPKQTLDLYRPASGKPARLIVFLHGGGWRGGDKNLGRFLAGPLLAQGYAVASLNYRLAAPIPPSAEVQDAALGIAYLQHNAARFGLDGGRFAVMGHSSGAHMVALLGVDAGYLRRAGVDPATLAAVVTLDGVFDVHANLTDFPNERRERVFGNDPAAWKAISPVDLLGAMQTHPRFCLAHEDTKARFVEQEKLFETALHARGEAVETVNAPGLGHAALARWFTVPGQPMAGFVLGCLGRAFGGK